MKILFFNYEYPPLGAGAGNASLYILREFAKKTELEVDFVTSSIDNEYHEERLGGGIVIHHLPIGKNKANLHFQSQKDLLVYSWRAFWFARKLTAKKQYDLTHSFFSVPCGFLSFLLKLEKNIPYIISLRGSDVPGYSDRFSFAYKFLTPLIKYIWRKADFVIANSQGLKDLALKTNCNQKIGIIYNGVDIHDFYPKQKIDNEKFIITNGATRITHRKGVKYIIEAVLKIVTNNPHLRFDVMGDGNAKEDLEAMVKDVDLEKNVTFIGRVPREETISYYQEADVFVMASLNEGMSNAMLEALSCGLPIITTKTGGAEELVKEGSNGFFVNFENSDDIADKLEILMNDRQLLKDMGVASRAQAEKMSWEKVALQYVELYKKTIK
jgi:glycosyltransferase involved in cell wall biosynthesis